MKANEAPDKLYLSKNIYSTFVYQTPNPEDETEVEYVRADVLIEKFVKWLKESITNNPECNRILSKKGVITMGELIKDCREYMKGE